MAITEAYRQGGTGVPLILGTLTAAATASTVIDLRSQDDKYRFERVVFQYVIARIVTNVVVRVEGSLDNVNWFNIAEDDNTITQLTDGTYAAAYYGLGEMNYIRLYWVSEAGGTAATIAVTAKVTERVAN